MADVILCGVITEKAGIIEKFCTNEALYVYPILGTDEVTIEDGICLCQLHSDSFDTGRSLVAATRKGNRYLLQLIPQTGDATIGECNSGTPPAAAPNVPSPT